MMANGSFHDERLDLRLEDAAVAGDICMMHTDGCAYVHGYIAVKSTAVGERGRESNERRGGGHWLGLTGREEKTLTTSHRGRYGFPPRCSRDSDRMGTPQGAVQIAVPTTPMPRNLAPHHCIAVALAPLDRTFRDACSWSLLYHRRRVRSMTRRPVMMGCGPAAGPRYSAIVRLQKGEFLLR